MKKGIILSLLIIFSSYLGCGTAKEYIGVIKDRGIVNSNVAPDEGIRLTTIVAGGEGITYCAQYTLSDDNAFTQENLDFLFALFDGAEGIISLDQYNNETCEDVVDDDPSITCDEIVYTQELENDVVQSSEDSGEEMQENNLWFSQEGVDDLVANISMYSAIATQELLEDTCVRIAERPMPYNND